MKTLVKNDSGFSAFEAILILVVLTAIGFAGWLVYKDHHKTPVANATTTSNNASTNSATKTTPSANTPVAFHLPSNWTWYINADYGFKLAYPQSWGQPTVFTNKGDVGTYFNINFYPPPAYTGAMSYNSRTPVNILMQTNDYSLKSCNDAGCRTSTATPTKTSIQSVIDSINNGSYSSQTNYNNQISGSVIAHDTGSYTIAHTQLPNGGDTTDSLVENKIVNLTKTNVSGAYVSYDIVNAPTTCKSNALSDNSQQLCLNQNDVNLISQIADSIESN